MMSASLGPVADVPVVADGDEQSVAAAAPARVGRPGSPPRRRRRGSARRPASGAGGRTGGQDLGRLVAVDEAQVDSGGGTRNADRALSMVQLGAVVA